MSSPDAIEVIIPVRNMSAMLKPCLEMLVAQLSADDVVTVVDDGSTDDTVAVAQAAGVRVLRAEGAGPYAARHRAAIASAAPYLLFVDARCRPLPGLLDAHRGLLRRPAVAMSCTNVDVAPGASFASRVAVLQQPFRLSATIGVAGKPDYFPTCNLGLRREAYLAVGGFRRMRSGGDADLCWRVQEACLGALAVDRRTFMMWVPRSSLMDLAEQWFRYGFGNAALERLHPRPTRSPSSNRSGHRSAQLAELLRGSRQPRAIPAIAVAMAMQLLFKVGLVVGRRRLKGKALPEAFGSAGPAGVALQSAHRRP